MTAKYRAEIDGLRAVAVVPVILFHAGFAFFSGGFFGVDVFFVISGYLITGIIHDEIAAGRFSVLAFYERRARRILPALFLVCFSAVPFAYAWMWPRDLIDFGQSLVAVSLFASNILFWIEADYFARLSELKPLLHTWSLGVEEQFYVFFPLLLLLCRRLADRRLVMLIVFLAVASLVLAGVWRATDRDAVFYLLPFRVWELGAGAVAALLPKRTVGGPVANIAGLLGLGLVGGAMMPPADMLPVPAVRAALPVLGTVLVIRFAERGTMAARLLSLRPVVGIGLVSYSAYLWHQPLLALARLYSLDELTAPMLAALCTATFGLAWLSWKYVETPFRDRRRFSRRQIFAGSAVGSLAMAGLGLVGYLGHGLPSRIAPEAVQMAAWTEARNPRGSECQTHAGHLVAPADACEYHPELGVTVALWGDSHASELAGILSETLAAHGRGIRELSYAGCLPAGSLYRPGWGIDCAGLGLAAARYLADNKAIDTVILSARWVLYLEGHGFDNGEGGYDHAVPGYAVPVGETAAFVHHPDRRARAGAALRSTVQALIAAGKRVVLVYPVPEIGWHVPDYLARAIQRGIDRQSPLSIDQAAYRERVQAVEAGFDRLGDTPGLLRVRPEAVFCDTLVPKRCAAELDGRPLYSDDNHLNPIGGAMLADRIVATMVAAGWLRP